MLNVKSSNVIMTGSRSYFMMHNFSASIMGRRCLLTNITIWTEPIYRCPLTVTTFLKQGSRSSWQLLLYYRGSAISKIIGLNVQNSSNFDATVRMWVYEEIVEGRNLSEIINEQHENVKYLPGVHLPENVVSWYIIMVEHQLN